MLAEEVRACTDCGLRKTCRLPVPGVGPTDAQIFYIGQSPGQREDDKNKPFVGPTGAILQDATESIGIAWHDTYRTNAVKCHPPNNRKAHVAEAAACYPWLTAELALWSPPEAHIIVAVGEDAARTLFPTRRGVPKRSLSELRADRNLTFEGHPVKVILHPAALLRPGGSRLQAEFDLDMEQVGLRLGTIEPRPPYWEHYSYCTTRECVDDLRASLSSTDLVGLDTEFGYPDRLSLLGASFSWADSYATWVPVGTPGLEELLEWLVSSQKRLAIHSVQADAPVVFKFLAGVKSLATSTLASFLKRTFDTAIAAYVTREPAVGLKPLSLKHFGIKLSKFSEVFGNPEEFAKLPPEEQYQYACADADIAHRLALGPYREIYDAYFH